MATLQSSIVKQILLEILEKKVENSVVPAAAGVGAVSICGGWGKRNSVPILYFYFSLSFLLVFFFYSVRTALVITQIDMKSVFAPLCLEEGEGGREGREGREGGGGGGGGRFHFLSGYAYDVHRCL